jgi:hypothetical protein
LNTRLYRETKEMSKDDREAYLKNVIRQRASDMQNAASSGQRTRGAPAAAGTPPPPPAGFVMSPQ